MGNWRVWGEAGGFEGKLDDLGGSCILENLLS